MILVVAYNFGRFKESFPSQRVLIIHFDCQILETNFFLLVFILVYYFTANSLYFTEPTSSYNLVDEYVLV